MIVVAFDGVQHLDVAGPCDVFSEADQLVNGRRRQSSGYRVILASVNGGPVTTASGLTLGTISLAAVAKRTQSIDTLMIAGGAGIHAASADRATLRAFQKLCARSRRITSVCTGAFLLAALGLLDGRRAVTHWAYCARLAGTYPEIQVEPDAIHIKDGPVWTSAGVTAGIDLSLALIEEDLGRKAALQVARELVVFLKRSGGQSQFSAPLNAQTKSAERAGANRFDGLLGWVAEHLDQDLRVERLADWAGMSPRNFARLFQAELNQTPAKFVESLRLEAARRALEDGAGGTKQIAATCGFGDEERMRRAFQRHLGLSPSQYRERFQS